jgi:cellulose synthase/poly-beta-1,6-N-acetylglucosamine synthase-like glycosyltransferase
MKGPGKVLGRLGRLPSAAQWPRLLLAVSADAEPAVAQPERRSAEIVQPLPSAPPGERRRRGRRRRRHNRHLRDALSRSQRFSLACFILSWAILSAQAWAWWLQPAHAGSTLGLIVNSALLAIESILLPTWFFFWLWRVRRPDPTLEVPNLRTAMVVTKAPAEPWPVVRETLEAMLAQDFPLPYNVWLADESPSTETLAWCLDHGVRVSTREGVAEYHRPTWPRRTRCKEGNLAYFYDQWGYELYDVVAQMDADHVPDPDYLRHMVVPFRDPHVGYVAAPSMCDRNAGRSWSARARLYAEAVLHGPMQAGHSGGCAPSCIGSHYAVRTAALREIGGLGPELAEDFTTTLMMSSYRWQGVFAIDARAHGDGPETVADCMTQEFQWSRSMMNVLLGVNGRYWRALSRAAKLRLGFCQIWYPLFAVLMVASIVTPLAAILSRTPAMRVSLGTFYLYFGRPTAVLLAVVLWLRTLDWLRPSNAKAIAWEIVLFQLVRWPWVLLGCVQAVAGRIAGREFDFKVTPKGRTGTKPLPLRVVFPYLLIALLSATPAILGLQAGRARGYYTLALLNVALYLGASVAIVVLHVLDHPTALRGQVLKRSSVKLATVFGTTALTVVGILFPVSQLWPLVGVGAAGPAPTPVVEYVNPRLAIGVTTAALAANATTPWRPADLAQVNTFEEAVHAHASIVMWYADWAHDDVDLAQLRAVSSRGSLPEITWEPWDYTVGPWRPQPQYTLASIITGRHDALIRTWARGLRDYGKPVLLRFAQEQNGTWYPWGKYINGNRPGEFAQAWRHVHDIFASMRATNVRWVWSPVARFGVPLDTSEYPGDAYVNIVGLSGFNGGTALHWAGWRPFSSLFDHSLLTLHRLAPTKPVQITEVSSATAGGSRVAWITKMFRDLRRQPSVHSIVWFDVPKQTNWQINRLSPDAAAFAAGLRALAPLTDAPNRADTRQ